MRTSCAFIVFCISASLCRAQTAKTDQPTLNEVRAKYDAPFNRGLQSFDCAIQFSWKQHFTETYRVGDEGTDDELQNIFQPIRTRVNVTQEKVTPSSNLGDDAVAKLPHGGMAEFLLEHAVRNALQMWLPTSTNAILPDPATHASLERSSSGYKLVYTMQGTSIEMGFDSDLRLQSVSETAQQQSERIETAFSPGPQGFVLTSLIMGENGNFVPGNRLIYTFTYQTVDGMQLPEQVVVNRESHHEVWRFTLSNCSMKKSQ